MVRLRSLGFDCGFGFCGFEIVGNWLAGCLGINCCGFSCDLNILVFRSCLGWSVANCGLFFWGFGFV